MSQNEISPDYSEVFQLPDEREILEEKNRQLKEKYRQMKEERAKDKEKYIQLEDDREKDREKYRKLEEDIAKDKETIIQLQSELIKSFQELNSKHKELDEKNKEIHKKVEDKIENNISEKEKGLEQMIKTIELKLNPLVGLADSVGKMVQTLQKEIGRISDLQPDQEPNRKQLDEDDTSDSDDVFIGLGRHNSAISDRRKLLHGSSCQNDQDDEHECCFLSEKHLAFVSERIGEGWKNIVRSLDMKEYLVEQVDLDHKGITEKAYQGLIECIRQVQQQPAHCWLLEVLTSMERNDIVQDMTERFAEIRNNEGAVQKELYIGSAENIFGREGEIEDIRKFCDETQMTKRILFINGLPGIGKKELMMQALSSVDRNLVVYPNFFMRERSEKRWTFDDILNIITKFWKADVNQMLSGDVNIRVLLSNVQKPFILILEIASLRIENSVKFMIWNFIRTLSRTNTKLKIIVTSCEYPQQLVLSNVQLEMISLRGLSIEDSQKLLQKFNPNLSGEQCKIIFQCCGGNPLLLREVSFKIKALCHLEGEIADFVMELRDKALKLDWFDRLLRQNYWSQKMSNVLEMMEDNELVVLAKLHVFITKIPNSSLRVIYGDTITLSEANHLYTNHSIFERDGKDYRISTLYRACIYIYILKDKGLYLFGGRQQTLASISEHSIEQARKFFLNLLQALAKMYNSKCVKEYFHDCENLISEYNRGYSNCCDHDGQCNNFITSMAIFQAYEFMINKFIKEPSYAIYREAFLSQPLEIVQFIRNVIPKAQLKEFKSFQFMLSVTDNGVDRAVAFATYVLLKEQSVKNEVVADIKTLENCIQVLEKGVDLSPSHKAVLLLCYLNRAQTYATVLGHRNDAYDDLQKAKEICDSYNIDGARIIEYYNIRAEIAYYFGEYDEAAQHRNSQVLHSVAALGDHPLTAKAYYLLAKSQEMISHSTGVASDNYNSAKNMFTTLKNDMMAKDVNLMNEFLHIESEMLEAFDRFQSKWK